VRVRGERVQNMKSPFDCRRYAEECRTLANGLSTDDRREILSMVDISECLARDTETAGKRKIVRDAGQAHRTASDTDAAH